jgi:glycosyltransferase involved in cell wall biosynthesis
MKVLFITYYFEPEPIVGAKRVSYWAKHFKKYSPQSEVYLITSTESADDSYLDEYFCVKSTAKPILSHFIKDEGLKWEADIKNRLAKEKISPTHVVISGSPFMQFGLVPFLKEKYSAKVILDYRDPFATNPRFENSIVKVLIKRFFEKSYNKSADIILSVNKYCLELLYGYKSFPAKFSVIPNGYDDSSLPKLDSKKEKKDSFNFIYAGTFYEDRSPEIFLSTIEKLENIKLVHLGKPSPYLENSKSVIYEGMKPYPKMLELISNQDAGLIITSGEPFESTTKIYDYIAMKIPIFVITSGELYTGAIADDLKGYPSVWAKNNEQDILDGIQKLQSLKVDQIDIEKFSRSAGLKKLISLLEENENQHLN